MVFEGNPEKLIGRPDSADQLAESLICRDGA